MSRPLLPVPHRTVAGAGTPARNITRLATFGVVVEWHENGTVDELRQAIISDQVPVVFLRIWVPVGDGPASILMET